MQFIIQPKDNEKSLSEFLQEIRSLSIKEETSGDTSLVVSAFETCRLKKFATKNSTAKTTALSFVRKPHLQNKLPLVKTFRGPNAETKSKKFAEDLGDDLLVRGEGYVKKKPCYIVAYYKSA